MPLLLKVSDHRRLPVHQFLALLQSACNNLNLLLLLQHDLLQLLHLLLLCLQLLALPSAMGDQDPALLL